MKTIEHHHLYLTGETTETQMHGVVFCTRKPWHGQWRLLESGEATVTGAVSEIWDYFGYLSKYTGGVVSQFSHSVVSDSLRPHEPQHTRLPCPSPTPGVHPNPCSLSRRCHPAISSSVVPFSSCPQSFPALGSFQMSQLFASGGQSIGVSASTHTINASGMGQNSNIVLEETDVPMYIFWIIFMKG